jgi:hypothetical protein
MYTGLGLGWKNTLSFLQRTFKALSCAVVGACKLIPHLIVLYLQHDKIRYVLAFDFASL